MTPRNADNHESVTFDHLKEIAAVNGPCLTALVLLDNPGEIEARFKNAIRSLRTRVEQITDSATSAGLMAPISDLAISAHADRLWSHAVILFRSPSVFRYYFLHGQVREMETVGDRFQVRPLLRALAHESRFHLLALSRKAVRLLECTQHRAQPVAAGAFPTNLNAWMNNRQPDHVMTNRSTAGPSIGRMKGVVSGSNADRDRDDEYLAHFFKEIDHGVTAYLNGRGGPLLLTGVDEEVSMYRRLNSYRPAIERAVYGSPDGVADRALHSRAMEIVSSTPVEPLRKAISGIQDYTGTPRASTDPETIVKAAFQGRVMDLLLKGDEEYWGSWNEPAQQVDAGQRREELWNAAALETIRHGGRAFVLNEQNMPVKSPAAAYFRF